MTQTDTILGLLPDAFDAVVAANGELPTGGIALEVLSKARFLCCCDGAGERLSALGYMPDAIVGDGDSMSAAFRESHAGIIEKVDEQDDNDLTKATRLCMSHGFARGPHAWQHLPSAPLPP